jgi:maltose/moltooligosaccharide transporter
MMIVVPMLIFSATMPLIYGPWLGSDPRNVLTVCGVLMVCAAAAVVWVRERPAVEARA